MTITIDPTLNPSYPAVDLLLSGLTGATVTVWRLWGGNRREVRGVKNAVVTGGSMVFVDYEAPFDTNITYTATASAAGGNPIDQGTSAAIQITRDKVWLSDPLQPSSAMPVEKLLVESAGEFGYGRDGEVYSIVGSSIPVGFGATLQEASGIPMACSTRDRATHDQLLALLAQADPVLIRWPAGYFIPLPPLSYCAVREVRVRLPRPGWPWWQTVFTATIVRQQAANIVVPPRTLDMLSAEASTLDDYLTLYPSLLAAERGY